MMFTSLHSSNPFPSRSFEVWGRVGWAALRGPTGEDGGTFEMASHLGDETDGIEGHTRFSRQIFNVPEDCRA